MRIADRRRT